MMKCPLLVSLLLAIQTEFSVLAIQKGSRVTVAQKVGNSYIFGADILGDHASRCVIKHNEDSYEIYPKPGHPRLRQVGGKRCSFELTSIQPEDAGIWDIMYFEQNDNDRSEAESDVDFTRYVLEVAQEAGAKETKESSVAQSQDRSVAKSPVEIFKSSSYVGKNAYFDGPGKAVVKCIAVHNDETYEIYPNRNLPNAKHEYGDDCSFSLLNLNWTHIGQWHITYYYDKTNLEAHQPSEYSAIHELTISEIIDVQPISTVFMSSGYASFYLPKTFDNPTSCMVSKDEDDFYELLGNNVDPNEGIELYNTCGVRMRYNNSRDGRWKLIQSQGDYQKLIAHFEIYRVSGDISPKTHRRFWQRGSSASLIIKNPDYNRVSYCDVVKPDGTVILLIDKSCKYEIDAVSDKHAGVWKGRYGVHSSMKLIEDEYIIQVWNPEEVDISVSRQGDDIKVLCRTGVRSLDSCIFESPNGTLLFLQVAIDDGKYKYYGAGFKFSDDDVPQRAECGININKPSSEDYGMWTCSMRNERETLRARIHVVDTKAKALVGTVVTTAPIYTQRGDTFAIKCTTDAPLNYCWMQSPNGTMYSVTKSGNGGNLLRYNGEGLSMGVCGAVVENADNTHNGDWSCRLGVVGAAEVESIVPVMVTESKLIPTAETIGVHQGKAMVMSCRTFPSSDARIDYCRWVRPNGHGIHLDNTSRYVSQKSNNTCTLNLNAIGEEDIGTWTCLARLGTGSDEEVWSKLELRMAIIQLSATTNTALHIVAIILFVTTLICGTFVVIALYRRKKRRTQPPPPAYDINYPFSKDSEIKVIPNFNNMKIENSFKQ